MWKPTNYDGRWMYKTDCIKILHLFVSSLLADFQIGIQVCEFIKENNKKSIFFLLEINGKIHKRWTISIFFPFLNSMMIRKKLQISPHPWGEKHILGVSVKVGLWILELKGPYRPSHQASGQCRKSTKMSVHSLIEDLQWQQAYFPG